MTDSLDRCLFLFQAGASPHLQDKTLRTPLMFAAENNFPQVVKYLLKAGAVINSKVGHWLGFCCACFEYVSTVTYFILVCRCLSARPFAHETVKNPHVLASVHHACIPNPHFRKEIPHLVYDTGPISLLPHGQATIPLLLGPIGDARDIPRDCSGPFNT